MNIFFAGKLQNGDFAVRIPRVGFDALSEGDLTNFLVHEDLENLSPLMNGQILLNANDSGVVDTFLNNTTAPPLVFFFGQRRFVPGDYIQMSGNLFCRNEDAFDFRKIRFVNGLSFQVIVTYFVYNQRIGV